MALGTPGEEGGGGKNIMAREGIFDGIDAMMLIYPGMDNIAASRTLLVTGVNVEYFGKAAHAAARPELGVNALDAVLLGLSGVDALRQQIRSDARIHGIIPDGGRLPKVIPDQYGGAAVRANDAANLRGVHPACCRLLREARRDDRGAAGRSGATRRGRALLTNAALARPSPPTSGHSGPDVRRRRAQRGLVRRHRRASHLVPIIQPQIAMTGRDALLHCTSSRRPRHRPAAAACIVDAAKAMAMSAIDLLADRALLRAVQDDFAAESRRE